MVNLIVRDFQRSLLKVKNDMLFMRNFRTKILKSFIYNSNTRGTMNRLLLKLKQLLYFLRGKKMMLLQNTDIDKIAIIFNTIFKKYNLPLKLDCNQIKAVCIARILNIHENDNPLFHHLRNLIISRKFSTDPFYHFKSFDRAMEILGDNKIPASNLSSNSENDFSEYSEFFRRIGAFEPFTTAHPIEEGFNFNKDGKSKIDEWRDDIFILCFTNDFRNPKFWQEYVNNYEGVCLKFNFKFKKHLDSWKFDFRNIFYDTGYDLDFINEISHMLRINHQLVVNPTGFTKFSLHYKRLKYQWENETRLSFNYSQYKELGNIFNTNIDAKNINRKYILLPKSNQFFDWEISEVICGYRITDDQITELKNIGIKHNKNIIVRRL